MVRLNINDLQKFQDIEDELRENLKPKTDNSHDHQIRFS